MKKAALPADISSYDILKSVAVLTMVIDHIGCYIFPEQEWWRAIGRMSAPIWFFLIGYARSRDISPALLFWASILLVADAVVGIGILPLNNLWTIILMRLVPERWVRATFRDPNNLLTTALILIILYIPTFFLTEYGSEALIVGWFGYVMRHSPRFDNGKGERFIVLFCGLFALATYVANQELVFLFSIPAYIGMLAGVTATMGVLYRFRPVTYPVLTRRMPAPLRALIQLCGRRTMEIYGIHLIFLKIVGYLLYPQYYELFHFTLLSVGVFGAATPTAFIHTVPAVAGKG